MEFTLYIYIHIYIYIGSAPYCRTTQEPPAPKVEEPQKMEQPIPDAQQEASGKQQDSQPKEPEATKDRTRKSNASHGHCYLTMGWQR